MSLTKRVRRKAQLGRAKAERGGAKRSLPQPTRDPIPLSSVRGVIANELAEDGNVVPQDLRGVEVDNTPLHVFGSSQFEVIAAMRAMDIPPAAPGSADSHRDEIDPLDYRRRRNAAKRARRSR